MARTPRTMLNKNGESGWACLSCPDLRGDAFGFSTPRMLFAVDLSYMVLIMLRYVPSIPTF